MLRSNSKYRYHLKNTNKKLKVNFKFATVFSIPKVDSINISRNARHIAQLRGVHIHINVYVNGVPWSRKVHNLQVSIKRPWSAEPIQSKKRAKAKTNWLQGVLIHTPMIFWVLEKSKRLLYLQLVTWILVLCGFDELREF